MKYTAVDKHGHSITSVFGSSASQANNRLEQQLNREGRYAYFRAWEEGGRKVKIEGGDPQSIRALIAYE